MELKPAEYKVVTSERGLRVYEGGRLLGRRETRSFLFKITYGVDPASIFPLLDEGKALDGPANTR
jgi:hypothetical protein